MPGMESLIYMVVAAIITYALKWFNAKSKGRDKKAVGALREFSELQNAIIDAIDDDGKPHVTVSEVRRIRDEATDVAAAFKVLLSKSE